MKHYKLSNSSQRNLKDVRNAIVFLVFRVLNKSPHDFGIPSFGGKRTAEQQNELFKRVPKVTWCDGYDKISYHQTGDAFDIFIYDEHGACWDCRFKYREVAGVFFEEFNSMKAEGFFKKNEFLRWGGHWRGKKKDLPHFEIRTL